jgi:hypothetical protein
MKRCCKNCELARRIGEGGLTRDAAICGSLEDAGYGEHVVLVDDEMWGCECDSWKPKAQQNHERPH